MTTNDNDPGTPALPDAQGQAALVLVESLLHGLMEQLVLSRRQAIEILDTAIEVQTDVADAADGAAEVMWRSHSMLSAISASLKRDFVIENTAKGVLAKISKPIKRENRRVVLLFHTMVGSNDIERSRNFYNALLGTLGTGEATLNMAGSGHTRLFYSNAGGTNFIVSQPINDEPASVANGSTVAFSCKSPEQVQQFHDVAVANGGTSIEDAPGPRETNMGTLHLTYVRDPDGNKLCGIYIPE